MHGRRPGTGDPANAPVAAAARRACRCRPSWSLSLVVALAYLAGKVIYRLRDIILLMVVAGFIALLLNPLVVVLQRWKVSGAAWP